VTFFVLALGLILRLINLNQSFWLDEASQAQQSALSLSQIWSGRPADFHPPLFYTLSHFWLQFGRSEIWLRLLPVTFGVANIYVLYLFARKLFPDKKIIIGHWTLKIEHLAGLLLSAAPFHIYYSQEFRSYSLLGLLGTLAMYFTHQRRFIWLAATNLILLYTHYSSIFIIFTQLAYFAIYSRKALTKFIIHNILFLVLYLPWFPQFSRQLNAGSRIDEYLPGWRNILSISPIKAFPVILFKLIAGRITFVSRPLYFAYFASVMVITLFSLLVARSQAKSFLFVWSFLPIFIMLLTSLAFPQNQPFRVIYVLPALILLIVTACLRFPKLFLTLFMYIALVGNIAYFTRPRLQREQWSQAAIFLQSQAGVVIIKFPGNFAPLDWYAPDLSVIAAVPTMPARSEEVAMKLSSLQASTTPVYLLEYLTDLSDPNRIVDNTLDQLGYTVSRTYDFPGVGFIYKYDKNDNRI